jgi:hypothetical protein
MSRSSHLHIFVLIDALGWPLVEAHDFLWDLPVFRTPLKTVFGDSSGAVPTILTGRPPAQHGPWNLFYFDPEGSPFRWTRHLSFLPEPLLNHRVTRKAVTEIGRRLLELGPLFECCVSPRLMPWFNWIEKYDVYDKGGVVGAPSIFDILAEKGIPYRVYTYRRLTDVEILRSAREDMQSRRADFFFLYLSEIDHFLHFHVTDTHRVANRLAWYDAELHTLYEEALEIDPEMTFAVFSDHGMTPVSHRYDLVKDVDALGFAMPQDYLAMYDSTMARFWFFKERARSEIVSCLRTLCCGRLLPDEELRRLGVMFPDRRYGEAIFLLHPGWLLSQSHLNGNGWNPVGMHGYHPSDPYSDAVFLCNRTPAVEMRTIADVFPMMLEATT